MVWFSRCLGMLGAVWVGAALAGQEPGTRTAPSSTYRRLVEKHLRPFPAKVQVAIALVTAEGDVFLGTERTTDGFQAVDNRKGLFEIGSITKVFTATLFAQAVAKGSLRLEDPVQSLLPFKLKASAVKGSEMTLKQLASHTSGIAHHQLPDLNRHAFFHGHTDDPFACFDPPRFEAYLREDLELAFPPGTQYRYSNLGMSLMGKILSMRAGKSYEDLLQEGIFRPLGMAGSTSHLQTAGDRIVKGLRGTGKPAPNVAMNAQAPAGNILSSAEDLARFARAQFEPAEPVFAMTQRPVATIEPGYHVGLGWHLVDRRNGERWLNHNGGMEGYTASININPKKRAAAVVLCNFRNDDEKDESIRALCREVLKELESGR